MEVVIVATPADAAVVVADVVARALATLPSPVIGLATGSSPLGAYGELIERCRRGEVTFAAADAVLLDEYLGLPPGHPEAYRAFIRRELTDHVDLDPARLHGPDVDCPDVPALCRGTRRCSPTSAGSTCSCSASGPTATSGSTSRARRSARARASRP